MVGSIMNLFGKSPVRPLQQHMARVQSCISELVPFFQAVMANDWAQAKVIRDRISQLEDEADQMKKALRMQLPKGLFMAMSRRDLLDVLTMQDKIANMAKDIAGRVLGRKMAFPASVAALYPEFVARCIDASAQAQTVINELDELVETGFRGNEVVLVESMLKKLDEIESDTDAIEVQVREALLKIEKELHPVDVMFLYQVIDWTGQLADLAQRVGSRLQLMLAR